MTSKIKAGTKNLAEGYCKEHTPPEYLYVYYKLKNMLKNRNERCFMQTSEIMEVMKITIRLPRKMKYLVLHQMECYGLIKRINHQKYWISDRVEDVHRLEKIKPYIEDYTLW